ncbi:MAG TPA: glucuronate isomerase [Steroidobacteraceae bacterium]|nr:glucuronate isomerase [Steroidobacteraceae bacterium]
MSKSLVLHPDRLFPLDPNVRAIARELYASVRSLPILSPHGHTDPEWFARNEPFGNATELLLAPDHYLFRMLYSQGIDLARLGVAARRGPSSADPREAWRLFASHFYLFRGTPSALWLNHVFKEVFGLEVVLDAASADAYFDAIGAALRTDAFRPRALFERFNIEVLATTESPLDPLEAHRQIRESGWPGRIITTYRPDAVVDPEHEHFGAALAEFGVLTGEDVFSWAGYLRAHRVRRAVFAKAGATATDHGHPTARTADLDSKACQRLFGRVIAGQASAEEAELFRAQMLFEMAQMSLDDGLVMQIHPGAFRNHNRGLFEEYGRDKGGDIPCATEYVHALKPLLDRFGNDRRLALILFTLDETAYSRELAPLAGHYPCLKLGPAWWFHDSPEGMLRFREHTTETAGFYNTVGFNDDTRAFLSIPARHDVARRVDCAFLARLVAEHRLDVDEAAEVASDLAYRLPKRAYRL